MGRYENTGILTDLSLKWTGMEDHLYWYFVLKPKRQNENTEWETEWDYSRIFESELLINIQEFSEPDAVNMSWSDNRSLKKWAQIKCSSTILYIFV